jgi:Flp pilus assembly protein TadB
MSPALAMLLGGLAGLGLLVTWRGAFPRPVPLADALGELGRRRPSMAEADAAASPGGSDWRSQLSRIGMGWASMGRDSEEFARRLRLAGRTPEQHAFEKVLGAVAGVSLPAVVGLMLAAGGITVPPAGVALASAALGAVGFLYAEIPLRERVEQRRLAFRHAFSSYLDLVTIVLAGGGGVETALVSAAESGGGWAFAEINQALNRARLTKRSPWDGLDDLGEQLGIEELRELASSVRLAGQDGARVKASVAAKADSLRGHQMAEVEARAEAASERMLVPVILLTLGLILFIGFGAVSTITEGGAATTASSQ